MRLFSLFSRKKRSARQHYEGASFKRHKDARISSASANSNLIHAHERLLSSARYLHDNNATARRAIDIITKYTAGITPHAVFAGGRQSEPHEAKLREFADSTACDPAGKQNLCAQQALIVRSMVRDGEVLVEKVIRPDYREKGLPLPLQTRVLECDYLDKTKISVSERGNPVFMGIEFDRYGSPLFYHMYGEHPGESRSLKAMTSEARPAKEIIHVMDPERPGQIRGISRLSPVIIRLRDLDEYEDAQLVRQKIAACFVVHRQNSAYFIS
ncbi:MAG: phage portal protein [Deltaproteobacteria bacterium]|nr:phage portal protein [Deltaproteobacteria bacterium]